MQLTKGAKTFVVGGVVALGLAAGAAFTHLSAVQGQNEPGSADFPWTDPRGVVDINQVPAWVPVAGEGGLTVGYVRGIDLFDAGPGPFQDGPLSVRAQPNATSSVVGYLDEDGFTRTAPGPVSPGPG
jgi:hypothetical protein